VLLAAQDHRLQWWFGAFSMSVAAWHLSTTLLSVLGTAPSWRRFNLICAVRLPVSAVGFLRLFIEEDGGPWPSCGRARSRAARADRAGVHAASTQRRHSGGDLRATCRRCWCWRWHAVAAGAARALELRARRLRFLVLMGALSTLFTAADYLPLVGLDIPPVGTVLTWSSCTSCRSRCCASGLLDLYELAGRLSVLTALSFSLAAVFWLLMSFSGAQYFMHSVAAALVVLLVYDPLRLKVEQKISQLFFRERYDLERDVGILRRRLAHVLELDHLPDLVLAGLESSRRVTHAAIYLLDADMRGYQLPGSHRSVPVRRLEGAAARRWSTRCGPSSADDRGARARARAHRAQGRDREAETSHEVVQCLEAMHASLCVALSIERESTACCASATSACATPSRPRRSSCCSAVRADRHRDREHAAVPAHEGARQAGRDGRDGGRPGARDPQSARRDQGQRAVSARDAAARRGHDEFLHIIVEEVDR
jgi:hypothetical protein